MARILLIEDNLDFRAVLSIALGQMGHEIAEASEGERGLELYSQKRFDVIITDLIMPGQEGIETITRLVKVDPTAKIIAMSGGGRTSPDSYLKMARRLGAKEILTKPFTMEELGKAIDALLAE